MIRLVSVNIERSKHLDRVLPFLREQQPDIVCVQELMERDVLRIERELGLKSVIAPEKRHPADGNPGVMCTGIFSRLPIAKSSVRYYWGDPERAIDYDLTDAQTKHATESLAVVCCDVEKGKDLFQVATTHFTWTPDGQPDDLQRTDMEELLKVLGSFGQFVLTGDFNAPRGGEIFSMLAGRYKDNIPERYTTSIDKDLHRAGDLQLMVDGIFSTPEYAVSDVELHSGISDHLAITATIRKNAA